MSRTIGAHVGGNFNHGSNDGLWYWNLSNASSSSNVNIGSRLLMELNIDALYFPHLLVEISRKQMGLVRKERPIDEHKKMKRYNDLFYKIADVENIKTAIIKASKRKRKRKSVQKILNNMDFYANEIHELLISKKFQVSPFIVSTIYDGGRHKERTIYKPRFYPDQIVHWAIMLQIEQILGKRMYYYSCASIKGKGTKLAFKGVKKAIKSSKSKYCLKLDVKKFYPSLDKEILKQKFRRVFKDNDLLWLLDVIIDGHPSQGNGVPIGNYTSQWFANFFLTDLDNFIKQELKVKHYIRYMDDIIVFYPNKRKLWKIKSQIEEFLHKEKLELKGNWQLFRCDSRPIDFLGFRFYKNYVTLRRNNFLRIKRRFKKAYRKRMIEFKDACAVISYNGFLKNSNCNHYLRKYLYPFISLKKCRKVVSYESTRRNTACFV